MRIVLDWSEVRQGLLKLRQCLVRKLGKPRKQMWNFPGGDGGELDTWYRKGINGDLAVAVGSPGEWGARTPILISRKPPASVMTPTVEVNVPLTKGRPMRTVNGCICVANHGTFVLCHRGNGFTVIRGKISKDIIHKHFKKWLVPAKDSDQVTELIPVGPVTADITDQLSKFADEVSSLKGIWSGSRKSNHIVRRSQVWRENIRFPKKVERAITPLKISREYRHGPIQTALQKELREILASNCQVVLNNQIDLGIVRANRLLAIFEVKTDLGDQLYHGIGQLLTYRCYFGSAKTKLSLVVSANDRQPSELTVVGNLLGTMGINLFTQDDHGIRFYSGAALANVLPNEWLSKTKTFSP